jgi:Zn-dependent M16 (insulinase) family peptidase
MLLCDWHLVLLMFGRYYIDAESVVVVGKPSATLANKIEADEKARIEAQIERFGPEGLERAAKELEEAKAENDKPIPPEVLQQFRIPSVKSISWIPVQSLQEPGLGRTNTFQKQKSALSTHIDTDGQELPFFVQYDHVEVGV